MEEIKNDRISFRYLLDAYDLLSFERVLTQTVTKRNCKIKRTGNVEIAIYFGKEYLPVSSTYEITGEGFQPILAQLIDKFSCGSDKIEKSHSIVFSGSLTDRKQIQIITETFRKDMTQNLPETFIDWGHFSNYVKEMTVMFVMTVSKNTISGVANSLRERFKNNSSRGTFAVKDKNIMQIRHEAKQNVFEYTNINSLTVVKTDTCLFAWGFVEIERGIFADDKQQDRWTLAVYSPTNELSEVQKIFDQNFEKSMIQSVRIAGGKYTGDQQIIKLDEVVSFEDVMMGEKARHEVNANIVNFFKMAPFYKQAGLPYKRGIILEGPTGTGKTMIAKAIISTFKETVIWVKADDIVMDKDITRIFRFARMSAPAAIIFEDIDFYLLARDNGGGAMVATMMANLDGAEENNGIMIICTTNRPDQVESAIANRPGRIDCRIFIGELGREQIIELLKRKLGRFKLGFDSFESVIPKFTVMTGAQVIEFSTHILKNAITDIVANKQSQKEIVISEKAVRSAFSEEMRSANKNTVGFGKKGGD